MAKQICKDCAGRGWIAGPLYALEGSYKCPTCDGTGTKHRTGPYRLADGTWSDGVDRSVSLRRRSIRGANGGRIAVWKSRFGVWGVKITTEEPSTIKLTFQEAVAYADRHARTTKNGDA